MSPCCQTSEGTMTPLPVALPAGAEVRWPGELQAASAEEYVGEWLSGGQAERAEDVDTRRTFRILLLM